MRVGILTFHFVANYGAVLQAFALSKVLRQLGHQPTIVNYVPPQLRSPWWQTGFRSGRFPSLPLMRWKFHRFRRQFLPVSRWYEDADALARDAASYDAFVVGSDQVWNMRMLGRFESTYFLGFVGSRRGRRLSYAACVGSPDQPAECLVGMRDLLEKFHAISVRDGFSSDFVREHAGRQAVRVVDPTLLTDFTECVSPSVGGKPYILVYGIERAFMDGMSRTVKLIQEHLGLRVVAISQHHDCPAADEQRRAVGPREWLSLFQNAAFVCTDSFHGSIFCLKNQRPFVAYTQQGWRAPRLIDLFSAYGIENRLIFDCTEPTVGRIVHEPIDYSEVHRRITTDVVRSTAFLRSALAEA